MLCNFRKATVIFVYVLISDISIISFSRKHTCTARENVDTAQLYVKFLTQITLQICQHVHKVSENGNAPFWPTHRTPNSQSHLLTHTSKSHLWSLISKIYHVLGEIYKVLDFPLLGLYQSPSLACLLPSCSKTCGHITESNYPKPQLTFLVMSF